MGLPFLLVDAGKGAVIPVLVGYDESLGGLIGFDSGSLELLRFDEADVRGVVSVDAAAVYYGAGLRLEAAAPLRLAAEGGTLPHSGPHRHHPKTEPYSRPQPPPESFVPHKLSTEYLAERFLKTHAVSANDPRVQMIVNALKTVGVRRIGRILGSGSFGTAATLDEVRIIKLTADPTEVQAGAVLVGRDLGHVARVYGSWFIQDVDVALDLHGDELYVTGVGALVAERLEAFAEASRATEAIDTLVGKVKTKRQAWPHQLAEMHPGEARELLYETSEELEQKLYQLGGEIAPDVAEGVAELRNVGIYAIDVHSGNIGWSRDEGVYKIFDVGSSSPPGVPAAKVLPTRSPSASAQLKLFGTMSPPMQVMELAGEANVGGRDIVWRRDDNGAYRAIIDGKPTNWRAFRNDNEAGPGGNRALLWSLHDGDDVAPRAESYSRQALTEKLVAILQHGGAEEAAKPVGRYAPLGYRFAPINGENASGFPEVEGVLKRHRDESPSIDTIRYSTVFAMSTVRTSIAEAERSFDCFTTLYKPGQPFPPIEDIKACFRGLQNVKARRFAEAAEYASVVSGAIASGLKDRKLRKHLATTTRLPEGLGLAKLSFTLALLGHDCICLDARLLKRMFEDKRDEVEGGWTRKNAAGGFAELSLKRYEAVEDAFLKRNPFYTPGDPIGRARAQWMSWESVGGRPATHSVWLRVVR